MSHAVEIDGLRVTRGANVVFDGLSLGIRAGAVTGLLGPSGSGKTTLLRAIVGVQIVERGTLTVLGREAGDAGLRRRLAYATQEASVYDDLSVHENLRYFAAVLGAPPADVERTIAEVGLDEQADAVVRRLSGGQRSRVSLAVALLGSPELLVLDEPTVGLDPVLRSELWGLFHRLAERGTSLLVSSHVMDEATRCDELVLLREGVARLLEEAGFEVVAQSGTADDLLRHVAMHKPDVAVVDIRMPPTHTDEGLRAAREIRERHEGVGVLLLSQYVEPSYAMALLETSAEGVGYLLKDRVADLEQFGTAVRRVADGGSALDPAVVSELVGRKRRGDPLEQLTSREREVLELMAEGRSNQAIAERLFVTLRAVEKHVTSIFTKLGLPASTDDHRRVLAVLAFLRA